MVNYQGERKLIELSRRAYLNFQINSIFDIGYAAELWFARWKDAYGEYRRVEGVAEPAIVVNSLNIGQTTNRNDDDDNNNNNSRDNNNMNNNNGNDFTGEETQLNNTIIMTRDDDEEDHIDLFDDANNLEDDIQMIGGDLIFTNDENEDLSIEDIIDEIDNHINNHHRHHHVSNDRHHHYNNSNSSSNSNNENQQDQQQYIGGRDLDGY